jgi:hypothetical protein
LKKVTFSLVRREKQRRVFFLQREREDLVATNNIQEKDLEEIPHCEGADF